MVNKLKNFQHFVYSSIYNIVAITETWLKDYIFDNEILSNDFTLYRNDCDSRGGGVMIAINNKIPSKQLPSPDNLEALIIQIFCDKKTFTLCLMYIHLMSAVLTWNKF